MRIAAARLQPFNIFISSYVRILAVDTLSGPVGGPVRRTLEELCGPESIWQHDAQRAVVRFLPQLEDMILRSFQGLVIGRQRGQDHGNLMRIGSDRLQVVLVSKERVRGPGKSTSQV